jgi:hypothetical protein
MYVQIAPHDPFLARKSTQTRDNAEKQSLSTLFFVALSLPERAARGTIVP